MTTLTKRRIPIFRIKTTFLYIIFSCTYFTDTSIAQGQITFRSDRSGDGRIYIMDADGTDLRLLEDGDPQDAHADTTNLYAAASPRWSPDGSQVVFYTYWGASPNKTDGQDIVIVNADGTSRQRLTEGGYNTDPAWSPDGKEIVFRGMKDGNWGLYIINIASKKIRLLIDTPYMDRSPNWSPDGKQIVFSLGYASKRPTFEDLYLINADGTDLTQLTDAPGEESLPRWSPDGQSIIYNEGTDTTAHLMTIKPDGSNKSQITYEGVNYAASYASDGNNIVYVSSVNGDSELFSMNLETGQKERLTNNPTRDNGGDWYIPDLNQKIVFECRIDGNDEIYVMNVDGSDLINLTQNDAEDRHPWWSPDGSKIYFETNRNGDWDIFEMESDGANPKPVLDSKEEDKYPGLSPDGKKIAMLHTAGEDMGLFSFETDGTNLKQLTSFNALGKGIYDHFPTWSPDGETICFASNRDTKIAPTRNGDDGLEIYTMKADGSQVQRLTFNEKEDSLPMFFPDGKQLLFNSSRTGNYHLYIMQTDGREVNPLTWGNSQNWSARFIGNGDSIIFVSSRNGGSDVYRMSLKDSHIRRLTFNRASKSPDVFIGK